MLLRRSIQYRPIFSSFSTLAEPKLKLDDFRTLENSPANQTIDQIGKFYKISPEIKKQLFSHGGFPKSFEKQVKTFGESCLMIREPALEVINHIKNADLNRPANRFVLYGKDGAGKSLTMAHLIHYGYESDFILVHIPWVPNWFKRAKEIANSTTKEGFIDLPLDAAAWLIQFKSQNGPILGKLDLKISQDYIWSKRETTPKGATLLELIDHGINRVKYASDAVAAVIGEIKSQSTAGLCKTMVFIDGYNAFFYPKTRIVADNKAKISPDKVTLTQPFLDITNYDWKNGVCILGVDQMALTEERMESELPRYQLGKEGFEHLDPFIPIRVDNYSDKEYVSCINYYLDRKWIQNHEQGFDKELEFLSGKSPYKLMQMCASL